MTRPACPSCHLVPGEGALPSDCGRAFRAWLSSHRRTARCRRGALAGELYRRGLSPFGPGLAPALDGPDGALRGEHHATDAPEEALLWGALPLPRYELRGPSGGQLWLPLWARVLTDVYVVLVAGWQPGVSERVQADKRGVWAAVLGYRDAAAERLAGDEDAQGALVSTFLLERERLLAGLVGTPRRLQDLHPQSALRRPLDLLRALGLVPGAVEWTAAAVPEPPLDHQRGG